MCNRHRSAVHNDHKKFKRIEDRHLHAELVSRSAYPLDSNHKTKPSQSVGPSTDRLKLYTHNTVALKSLSGKIIPKSNLTFSPEFDGCAGKP